MAAVPDHEYLHSGGSTSEHQGTQGSNTKPDFSCLCRICANSDEYLIPIFEGEGVQLELQPKLEKYLPVTINPVDELPTSVCYQCASSIMSWHDLIQNCISADKQLRIMKEESAMEIETRNISDATNEIKCELSNYNDSSNSCKETEDLPSEVQNPKFNPPHSSIESEDSVFSANAKPPDLGRNQVTSEKLLTRAKPDRKATKIKDVKKQSDAELMVSLVPEVKLIEDETEAVLGKRKRKRASYFSYGDYICDELNLAKSDRKDVNQKEIKNPSKNSDVRKNKLKQTPGKNNAINKFSCRFCSAQYSRNSDAMRHERQKHPSKLKKAQKIQSKVDKDSSPVKEELNLEGITLKCNECQSQFENKLEMIKHLQATHSDLFSFDDGLFNEDKKSRSKRYFCNICSAFVKGRKRYLVHHKSEHPGKKLDFIRETTKQLFHCDLCNSGFTRHSDLFRHLKRKHLDSIILLENKCFLQKRIVCKICESEFSSPDEASMHISQIHSITEDNVTSSMLWACSLCDGKFDSLSNLVAHGNACHKVESESKSSNDSFGLSDYSKKPCPATCDVCGVTFTHRSHLTTHKSRHITMDDRLKYEPTVEACKVIINNELNFRCNRCTRMFSKEDLFIRHMILHDTGKTFCCHMCGFQCFTQAHLKRHINVVHLKKRDFKCDICGHAFAEKQAMIDHRRTPTGERPCQCKICGKMFPSWTCVYTHKRSHTDYFPYPCTEPDCTSKFRTKYRLIEHMRRHTGEKPFSCPVESCDRTFHDKRAISRHLTVHTDDRPYGCTFCNRVYKHKKYLSFHLRTNHNIKMSQINEQVLATM